MKKTNLKPTKPPKPAPPLHIPLKCKDCNKKLFSIGAWVASDKDYWTCTHYYCKLCHHKHYEYPKRQDKWNNELCLTCEEQLLNKEMWNDIPGRERICDTSCQYTIFISNWVSHRTPITANKIWQMANAKIEGTSPSKILEIKNNPLEPTNIVLVLNPDAFLDLENSPKEFYEHYQNLAPMREEQEQRLEEINTRLCDHCLIPCDFQFYNDCNLIYNLPLCMIYMIPEEKKPISSCASELESVFNPNSNSNNDNDENTSFSSVQNGNKNNSN
ncbi:hypothetical protein G9A89_011724 [Geosiphon pyriformis]|nr:hypothetical protein G9A89_011724 [Geosiphon pyriformis]